jgi:hypothetical protein
MKKFVKNFIDILNESSDQSNRGQLAAEFLEDLKRVIDLCPNLESIKYPHDLYGHASKVIDLVGQNKDSVHSVSTEGALTEIEDGLLAINDFYETHFNDDRKLVKFFIWHVDFGRGGDRIEKLLEPLGGSGRPQDIELPMLIQLLEETPELAEKVRSLSISLDSHGSRDFRDEMSAGKHGNLD